MMVSLLVECAVLTPAHPCLYISAQHFLDRSAMNYVRRVTELLRGRLSAWQNGLVECPDTIMSAMLAIKTLMMMLVRGCSIISYDDYHIILHHHSTDKLSLKIKVSPTSKRFFINIFIEC